MAWFSSKPSNPSSEPTQLEQKSHLPLNIAPGSDISTTLNQISDHPSDIKITEISNRENINQSVSDFVAQRPSNLFVIDGEKDKKESIICTSNSTGGKTCLKLGYNSIELFKHMQKLEYFCSLPDDINATYFECRKIQ
ncbi:hypothetical protein CLIB1423_17S01728 [[Candida] railenensis]|uniref:Uncharacterized protein n=1 Tax=[Candida] railenensis TaxID=45579 RepID=A0A9P0QTN6_9ASCO|nr:hypothetical protein CLIB1423_17S01728 [[Candida] railenensis]